MPDENLKQLFLPGLNIQFPISQKILDGKKTIETRTYPLPKKYEFQPMYLVETPGSSGHFETRISGIITFRGSYLYESETAFYQDSKHHLVTKNSPWAWKTKPKWAWVIANVTAFTIPLSPGYEKRGIVFTRRMRPISAVVTF